MTVSLLAGSWREKDVTEEERKARKEERKVKRRNGGGGGEAKCPSCDT